MPDTAERAATINAVTSDDLVAQALAKADPPEPKPEPVADAGGKGDKPPADAEVEQDEEDPKPAKGKPKINERMSELVGARKAAEERAAASQERAAAAERERDELRARLNPPPAADPTRPKPEDFPDAFQYAGALADYAVKAALHARDKAEADRRANESHAKVVESWATRAEAVKTDIPDYAEIVGASKSQVSDAVRDALMESDFGPRILYEIATDPDLAAKLEGKTGLSREEDAALARAQLKLIGKLETRFETKTEPEEAARAEPVVVPVVRRAPAPIVPVKGTKTADVPLDSSGEYTGSFDQYKRDRKAGRI